MESLNCLKCSAPLHKSDFDTELGVAKCRYCEAWFKMDALNQASRPVSDEPDSKPEIHLPVPEYFEIKETPHQLEIRMKWLTDRTYEKIGCSLVALVVFMVLSVGAVMVYSVSPLKAIVVLAVSIVCGWIFFSNIRKVDNENKIIVHKEGNLDRFTTDSIKPKSTTPVAAIKQLYCTEQKQKEQDIRPQGDLLYSVNLLLNDNKTYTLVSELKEKQDAILIERRIEQFLGIANEPVAGEIHNHA